MTTKRKTKEAASPLNGFTPNKTIPLPMAKNASRNEVARGLGEVASGSAVAAARVIVAAEGGAGIGDQIDMPGLIAVLHDQAKDVQGGELWPAEAMLMNQATALQSLFVRLIERGLVQEHLPQYEAHMRLALRAQSQCRATLETLATIKNPPVVIARQANVTSGPQQINNGMPAPTRAREIEAERGELLGEGHGERMDTGTAGAAIGGDKTMATLAAIDRAADGGR